MKRALEGVAALLSLLATTACDPCFGVYQCESDPRVSFEGGLIVHWDGAPVSGVEIEFVRTGGVELTTDTLRAITNREGRFHLAAPAREVGAVEGRVLVKPPAHAAYVVEGVAAQASRSRGEGSILPRWVVDPYFPYVGELFARATGEPLAGAEVEFRRTGGVGLYGALEPDGSVVARTDQAGRFVLLEYVYPLESGEVVGELRVLPAGSESPVMIGGVRLESTHLAYHPPRVARFGTGASLSYVGELHYRAGRVPAAGVEVEYRRVGGVLATPETFVTVTGPDGRFPLLLTAAGAGEVIAELRVRPPPPYAPETIRDVRIPTFEADGVRLLGVWGVGFSFNHVGELLWGDTYTAAAGVEVQFRRTGGVPTEPESYTSITDAAGRFLLMPRPLEAGEVVFELTITPPGATVPTVIPGVRMHTTQADSPSLLGVWLVPRP